MMKNMKKLQESKNKINKLIEVTIRLIEDCSLENGAILAANSTKNNYPKDAKNYFYVWPRDASFACIVSDILGIQHVQENFFRWCLTRAEGFKKNGLFYEKYYPNGLKALANFQPDQTGLVLLAIWYHYKNNNASKLNELTNELIKIAADGICNVWKEDHFTQVTNDLWEERLCFPDLNENFSFSLAACIRGLRCANEFIPNKEWIDIAEEMKNRLDKHCMEYFIRSYGNIPDRRIDASIIGLVYPFEIYEANDPRIVSSINEIENKLSINGGIHRYEHDEYDGWMYDTLHRKKGAGAWPLLNFWMSIYYSIKGDKENAKKYYYWVFEKIKKSDYIPEQIFENDIQVSVSPLLWSHSMFVLASNYLNLI
jgi:glucoamylase